MKRLVRLTAAGLLAMVALTGCSAMQENRPLCIALASLGGAVPGAVGGAVGVKNVNRDNNPGNINGHIAAGSAIGAVAGGPVRGPVRRGLCPPEGRGPPPP